MFSDAENLPSVASLCRWQRYKAVMPDSIGHPSHIVKSINQQTMIAKIVTGASFGGCTAYAYGKDQAEVIAHDGIIPDNPKIAAKCFEIQSQLNPRVSKPVGHIAISFKPEDKPRLTNEFMVQIEKEYMEKMGIKDTQYVIVRHHNTPNPHCHLIFNRVDNNGKLISDSNWLKRNVRVCKELKQKYGLTFGKGKSQTRTERLRPNERTRYEMANDVRSALKDSHSWKDFSNNLKTYGIRAEIKFRSGTHIPQGISFTRDGTTFKGSSLDRSLSFSKIDTVLTGGVNIDTGGQAQDPSANESRSKDQDHSLTTDLSMLAADLAIGLIASGQEKKSEEQNLTPNKKRGPRL